MVTKKRYFIQKHLVDSGNSPRLPSSFVHGVHFAAVLLHQDVEGPVPYYTERVYETLSGQGLDPKVHADGLLAVDARCAVVDDLHAAKVVAEVARSPV